MRESSSTITMESSPSVYVLVAGYPATKYQAEHTAVAAICTSLDHALEQQEVSKSWTGGVKSWISKIDCNTIEACIYNDNNDLADETRWPDSD